MLNEKSIDFLSEKLKVDSEELKKIIDSEEKKDITDLDSPVKYFFTDDDKKSLEDNVMKQGEKGIYDRAKAATIEMNLKSLNKKYKVYDDFDNYKEHGFNVSETSLEDFANKFDEKYKQSHKEEIENLKGQFSGEGNEEIQKFQKKMETLKKEKAELQDAIRTKETEFEQTLKAKEGEIIAEKRNDRWGKAASVIPFDASAIQNEEERLKYIQTQQELLLKAARDDYRIEFEDGKEVVYRGEEMLVDDMKNPIKPEDALIQVAKKYNFKMEAERKAGRGGASSTFSGVAVRNIKTQADYESYCQQNNIAPLSAESDELHRKIIEYNPDYNKK